MTKSWTRIFKMLISVIIIISLVTIIFDHLNKRVIYKNVSKISDDKIDNKIINQCVSYMSSSELSLYGYLDVYGIDETLMYYYFNLTEENLENYNTIKDEIIKTINETEICDENVDSYVNYIYYMSLISNKYNLGKLDNFFVKKILDYEIKKEDSLLKENNLWKISNVYSEDDTEFSTIKNIVTDMKINNLSNNIDIYSDKVIKAFYLEDISQIRLIYKEISDLFNEGYEKGNLAIDEESYIIILNILSNSKELNLSKRDVDFLISFMEKFSFTEPVYIEIIIGNMLDRNIEESNLYIINDLFTRVVNNQSINSEGKFPQKAVIMPSYKRFFEYYELCNMHGLDIFNEYELKMSLYRYNENSYTNNIKSIEDIYYLALMKAVDNEIEIDDSFIKNYLRNFANQEIIDENVYQAVMLVRAANIRKIDTKQLCKKVMEYCNNSEYTICKVWGLEMNLLLNEKKNSSKLKGNVEKLLLDYNEEEKLETYFQYVELLNRYDLDISEELKAEIISYVDERYVSYGIKAGYYEDEKFKSIDMSTTYKCLYIKEALEK